jgi:hypothetical protein
MVHSQAEIVAVLKEVLVSLPGLFGFKPSSRSPSLLQPHLLNIHRHIIIFEAAENT